MKIKLRKKIIYIAGFLALCCIVLGVHLYYKQTMQQNIPNAIASSYTMKLKPKDKFRGGARYQLRNSKKNMLKLSRTVPPLRKFYTPFSIKYDDLRKDLNVDMSVLSFRMTASELTKWNGDNSQRAKIASRGRKGIFVNSSQVFYYKSNDLYAEKSKYASQISDYESEKLSLESQIAQLESQKSSLESYVRNLEYQNESLESRKDYLESQKSLVESKITHFNSEKSSIETQITQFDSEKSSIETQITQFDSQIAQLDSQKSLIETQILYLEARKSQLASQKESIEIQISNVNDDSSLDLQITLLDLQINQLDLQINQLDLQINQLDSQITQIDSQITQFNSQITPLDSQITQFDSQITQLYSQITQLDSQITQLSSQRDSLESEISSIELYVSSTRMITYYTTQIENISNQVVTLQSNLSNVNKEINEIDANHINVIPQKYWAYKKSEAPDNKNIREIKEKHQIIINSLVILSSKFNEDTKSSKIIIGNLNKSWKRLPPHSQKFQNNLRRITSA